MSKRKEIPIRQEDRAILETINPDQILTEVQSASRADLGGQKVERGKAILIVRKIFWFRRDEETVELRLDPADRRALPSGAREIPVITLIFDKSSKPFASIRLLPLSEIGNVISYNRRGVFLGFDPELPQIWVGAFHQKGQKAQSSGGIILLSFIEEKGATGVKDTLINLLMTGKPE